MIRTLEFRGERVVVEGGTYDELKVKAAKHFIQKMGNKGVLKPSHIKSLIVIVKGSPLNELLKEESKYGST